MNYFVSDFTLESLGIFLFLGMAFSLFHDLFFALLELPSVLHNALVALKGSSKVQKNHSISSNSRSHDLIRAIMILLAGIIFVLTVYAICDGVPRIYALTFTLLGFYVLRCVRVLLARRINGLRAIFEKLHDDNKRIKTK